MIRSFTRLQQVSPGLKSDHVLTMELSLSEGKYAQGVQRKVLIQRIVDRLKAIPGVNFAGATTLLPLSGGNINSALEVEGEVLRVPGQYRSTEVRVVTPDYFKAMGIPLEEGRVFTAQDTETSPHVLLVNWTLAQRWVPHEDPIGRRANLGWNGFTGQIVGVVADTREFGLSADVREEVYVPYIQAPFWPTVTLALRTSSDASSLSAAARAAILRLEPDQPVSKVRTLEQVVSSSVSQPRFRTLLLGLFAAVALILAAVGIYSVISYSVAQRTHEIGIRMAIGAGQGDVLWLVVRQSMTLVLMGVASGTMAALGLTRLLTSWLYHVRATDPPIFGGVALLLALVALLASYIPARRATKVDPMVALRYE